MFKVDREICIACEQCIKDCPVNDIYLKEGKAHIKNEACIKCGHCIAICPVKAVSTDDYDMNEVIEYKKEDFEISPDRLLNFIKFRRSVRRFKDKEVEKEKIEKIIEAGRFTQTGTNSQDVSFTVLTKDLPKIKELTYEILNKKGQYILDNMNDNIKHLERYANLWTRMYVEHKKDPQNYDRLFGREKGRVDKTETSLSIHEKLSGNHYHGFIGFADSVRNRRKPGKERRTLEIFTGKG